MEFKGSHGFHAVQGIWQHSAVSDPEPMNS